jgi:CubicO group peptidase (beta-lactamase class C family)
MATAMGILQLVDQDRIALEDPVAAYLPFFEIETDREDGRPITLRMLLNHTSGLKDTMPAMMGWVHFDNENRDQTELLRRVLPDYAKLRDTPGQSRAYSNLGYIVLGAVIESVTGQRYEHYIENEVLAPMGIRQTGFLYPAGGSGDTAAGSHPLVSIFTPLLPFYVPMDKLIATRTGTRLWFNRFYIDATPSTGLIGTAGDAARLAWAFADNSRVLPPDMLALTRQGEGGLPLGWEGYSRGGTRWYQHRGGGPGFASIMRLYPEQNIAIAVLANNTNLKREALCDLIAGVDWKL